MSGKHTAVPPALGPRWVWLGRLRARAQGAAVACSRGWLPAMLHASLGPSPAGMPRSAPRCAWRATWRASMASASPSTPGKGRVGSWDPGQPCRAERVPGHTHTVLAAPLCGALPPCCTRWPRWLLLPTAALAPLRTPFPPACAATLSSWPPPTRSWRPSRCGSWRRTRRWPPLSASILPPLCQSSRHSAHPTAPHHPPRLGSLTGSTFAWQRGPHPKLASVMLGGPGVQPRFSPRQHSRLPPLSLDG